MPGTSSPVHTPTTAAIRWMVAWSRAKTLLPAALAATMLYVGTASPLLYGAHGHSTFLLTLAWIIVLQLEICGEETVAAMLKTTKRFLGQQRFERLSKVFWCENFATDGERLTHFWRWTFYVCFAGPIPPKQSRFDLTVYAWQAAACTTHRRVVPKTQYCGQVRWHPAH